MTAKMQLKWEGGGNAAEISPLLVDSGDPPQHLPPQASMSNGMLLKLRGRQPCNTASCPHPEHPLSCIMCSVKKFVLYKFGFLVILKVFKQICDQKF